jgi:hypothetical protein
VWQVHGLFGCAACAQNHFREWLLHYQERNSTTKIMVFLTRILVINIETRSTYIRTSQYIFLLNCSNARQLLFVPHVPWNTLKTMHHTLSKMWCIILNIVLNWAWHQQSESWKPPLLFWLGAYSNLDMLYLMQWGQRDN